MKITIILECRYETPHLNSLPFHHISLTPSIYFTIFHCTYPVHGGRSRGIETAHVTNGCSISMVLHLARLWGVWVWPHRHRQPVSTTSTTRFLRPAKDAEEEPVQLSASFRMRSNTRSTCFFPDTQPKPRSKRFDHVSSMCVAKRKSIKSECFKNEPRSPCRWCNDLEQNGCSCGLLRKQEKERKKERKERKRTK